MMHLPVQPTVTLQRSQPDVAVHHRPITSVAKATTDDDDGRRFSAGGAERAVAMEPDRTISMWNL